MHARYVRLLPRGVEQPRWQQGGIGEDFLGQHCQRGFPVTSHREGSVPAAAASPASAAATPTTAAIRRTDIIASFLETELALSVQIRAS